MDGWHCCCRIDLQKIILSNSHKKILTELAENEKPNESCAILYGDGNTVKEIWITENIENSPIEFTISPEQTLEMHEKQKELGIDVIGIFHSHPNSQAVPSSTDRKFMENNPYVWIIYSGVNKDLKAYVLESEIKEIPIEEK
jgi:proteasome lid subunit RPN8/RPN11